MSQTQWMVESTSFETILNHLEKNPEIKSIVDVRDQQLHEVGDLFIENSEIDGAVQKAKELIDTGKIFISHSKTTCLIPNENKVECIMLPPFYLVRDCKVPYINQGIDI